MKVTDKDREAADKKAWSLLEQIRLDAIRNLSHDSGITSCSICGWPGGYDKCALCDGAALLDDAIAQACEEGRREEREAIINDLALTTRYSLCGDNGIVPSMGGDYMDARETFDTIRARGDV